MKNLEHMIPFDQLKKALYQNIKAENLGGHIHIDGRGVAYDEIIRMFVDFAFRIQSELEPSTEWRKTKIVPIRRFRPSRTGNLSSQLTYETIVAKLGFEPNVKEDKTKVTHSWSFEVDGVHCAIWDYRGIPWSTFGPREKFIKIFGSEFVE